MEVVWEKNFLYENIWKKGITLDPLVRASRTCHAYLFFVWIMWCKFHFDDLKTVGGVWDTSFHQQTDCPMTQVNSPSFSSVGNKKNAHIIIVTYWLLEMSTAFNRGACAVTIHVHHVCWTCHGIGQVLGQRMPELTCLVLWIISLYYHTNCQQPHSQDCKEKGNIINQHGTCVKVH